MNAKIPLHKIHYTTSNDANPECEKCGARIDPGRNQEPYTRTLWLWQHPPHGYHACTDEHEEEA